MSTPDDRDRLHWAWVGAGVILGAVLVSLFIYLVDPGLERPAVSALMASLAFILTGILVGYRSRGETIREAAVVGLILMLLISVVGTVVFGIRAPALVWLLSPFYAAMMALVGGYAGEMLQGTMAEAHEDKAIDWPWVFVSVVIGFSLSTYLVLIGRATIDLTPSQSLVVFALSFMLTGWFVGYFSPGVTMIEPAIAAGGLVALHAGFIVLWFEVGPPLQTLLVAFTGGVLAALAGGWLGERMQRTRQR